MGANRANLWYHHENMIAAPAATSTTKVIWKTENGILICSGTAAISVLEAEAADTYAPGCVYILVSGASSNIYVNQGAAGSVADFGLVYAADQQSAITTELTDLTHTAPSSPDYAIQDLTTSTPYGFVTKDEGNTVLKVIQANKVRIQAIEDALQAVGILA